MCEVVIVYLYGSDTFIGLLSLTLNHNATFTVVDHWDAHLGLRLTTSVLYYTLTCRPLKSTGWTVGIAYSEHPVETFTGRTQLEKGLWPSISFTTIFTTLSLDAGLWFPQILKEYYLKILTCCQELFLLCYFCCCFTKSIAFHEPRYIFGTSKP